MLGFIRENGNSYGETSEFALSRLEGLYSDSSPVPSVCGGSGAGPTFHGADAVQINMVSALASSDTAFVL